MRSPVLVGMVLVGIRTPARRPPLPVADAEEVAVAVLGGDRHAAALADRIRHRVVATSADDHLDVVTGLGASAPLVVGVAVTPWPQHARLHGQVADVVPTYRGVVAWHGLPLLLDELAKAAVNAVAGGAHLLVTAPDPGPDATPEELTFLREVAEGVAARTDATARSVAWRGDTRTPTAVDALTSVLTVHGRRDVLELPVAPGTPADPRLAAVAEQHGGRLTTADLRAEVVVDALMAVVGTVADTELRPRDVGERPS